MASPPIPLPAHIDPGRPGGRTGRGRCPSGSARNISLYEQDGQWVLGQRCARDGRAGQRRVAGHPRRRDPATTVVRAAGSRSWARPSTGCCWKPTSYSAGSHSNSASTATGCSSGWRRGPRWLECFGPASRIVVTREAVSLCGAASRPPRGWCSNYCARVCPACRTKPARSTSLPTRRTTAIGWRAAVERDRRGQLHAR